MEKEIKSTKKKYPKGITLVALVVTIVVLIILATISINIIFGEEGIVERAKLAKKDYANAQEEEKEILADTSNSIDGYITSEREKNNKKSVLLEREWGAASSAIKAATTNILEEISFAEYGTGKAIISYSVRSGTTHTGNLDISIYKVENETNKAIAHDRCYGNSTEYLSCSTSTIISYDENTVINFNVFSAVALTPTYGYSILIIPD